MGRRPSSSPSSFPCSCSLCTPRATCSTIADKSLRPELDKADSDLPARGPQPQGAPAPPSQSQTAALSPPCRASRRRTLDKLDLKALRPRVLHLAAGPPKRSLDPPVSLAGSLAPRLPLSRARPSFLSPCSRAVALVEKIRVRDGERGRARQRARALEPPLRPAPRPLALPFSSLSLEGALFADWLSILLALCCTNRWTSSCLARFRTRRKLSTSETRK